MENRPGSLMDVTTAISEAHVNIRAVASFDTPDFAIMRLVVDKPEEAKEYLTSRGFIVRIQEVMGAVLEDKKGNLNHMLSILAQNHIDVKYIYSFIIREGKEPVMVFDTSDYERAAHILEEAGVEVI